MIYFILLLIGIIVCALFIYFINRRDKRYVKYMETIAQQDYSLNRSSIYESAKNNVWKAVESSVWTQLNEK